MKRRVKILVSGRVQGVGFRHFTWKMAVKLGILGSVRNLGDGRVEIIAESGTLSLDEFILACQTGPVGSRVDKLELSEMDLLTKSSSFEIK